MASAASPRQTVHRVRREEASAPKVVAAPGSTIPSVRKLVVSLALTGLLAVAGMVPGPGSAAAPPSPSPSPSPGAPSTPDQLALQLQQQLAEQQALAATKESLGAEIQAAKDQQKALNTVIDANQTAIAATLVKLAAAEKSFRESSARAVTEHSAAVLARQQEHDDKALLASFLRSQYVSNDHFVDYVLSSSSVTEMFGRASDLSHLVDRGKQLTVKVRQDAADAESAEASARKDAATAQASASELSAQETTLNDQTSKAQTLIGQLNDQARAASREIYAANSQSLAVAQEVAATRIAQLDATIAAAEQADWEAASYWIAQHLGALPGGFATPPSSPGTAHFVWPAPGAAFVQPFGPSPYPFEPAYGGYPHFHTGLDLARGTGSPILATADGVVVIAGVSDVGYGNHVILAHAGGFLSLYGHLQSMLVKPGDTVHQGQLIGLMGSTGNSTGSHVHFEVRFNNHPVDPMPFLPGPPPPQG